MAAPCSSDSDERLLERTAAGDGRACRILLDRHLGPVLGFSARVLGNLADAENVAQETFLSLRRQAGRWRPGQAKLSTSLHTVARNRCLDRLAQRREASIESVQGPAADPVDPAPGPAEALARRDRLELIGQALMALPERQRMALTLCHFQELGNIEAAAVMEISVAALEGLLGRGRRQLRERLSGRLSELLGEP